MLNTSLSPWPSFTQEEADAVSRVLLSNKVNYWTGQECREFEKEFAAFAGTEYAVALANGTLALDVALKAMNIGAGDDVIVTSRTFLASASAIVTAGANPVFADVDLNSQNISADTIQTALTPATKAIIVVHLAGMPAEMDAIMALAEKHKLWVIEDCAQAHGAALNGRRAGSWGALGCFSFYPTKNLGALGDGGAVVTGDAALAERLRALRQYGWVRKYEVAVAGGVNSRLDELQAAVLAAKLPHLDAANVRRRAIAARYSGALADLPLQCPPTPGADHVMHLYVVRTPRRAALQAHLAAHGIASDVHYPIADHLQLIWAHQPSLHLPVTEAACAQVLSLPCYPGLSDAQSEQVIEAVRGFFARA